MCTHAPAHVQWAKFIVANAVGFVVNRGAFFLLVALSPPVAQHPVIGIAAGSPPGWFSIIFFQNVSSSDR